MNTPDLACAIRLRTRCPFFAAADSIAKRHFRHIVDPVTLGLSAHLTQRGLRVSRESWRKLIFLMNFVGQTLPMAAMRSAALMARNAFLASSSVIDLKYASSPFESIDSASWSGVGVAATTAG